MGEDSGWFAGSATVDATGVAGGGEGVLRVSRYRKWLLGSHWLLGGHAYWGVAEVVEYGDRRDTR